MVFLTNCKTKSHDSQLRDIADTLLNADAWRLAVSETLPMRRPDTVQPAYRSSERATLQVATNRRKGPNVSRAYSAGVTSTPSVATDTSCIPPGSH